MMWDERSDVEPGVKTLEAVDAGPSGLVMTLPLWAALIAAIDLPSGIGPWSAMLSFILLFATTRSGRLALKTIRDRKIAIIGAKVVDPFGRQDVPLWDRDLDS